MSVNYQLVGHGPRSNTPAKEVNIRIDCQGMPSSAFPATAALISTSVHLPNQIPIAANTVHNRWPLLPLALAVARHNTNS
jgi:hypothetical protein